jgi:hypothetical protein
MAQKRGDVQRLKSGYVGLPSNFSRRPSTHEAKSMSR